MKELREIYFSMQTTLFPVLEEEKIELSGKMKEFVELIEAVNPARFLNDSLHWTGLGRPMKDREAVAFPLEKTLCRGIFPHRYERTKIS